VISDLDVEMCQEYLSSPSLLPAANKTSSLQGSDFWHWAAAGM